MIQDPVEIYTAGDELVFSLPNGFHIIGMQVLDKQNIQAHHGAPDVWHDGLFTTGTSD